jgi:hypothetical protein
MVWWGIVAWSVGRGCYFESSDPSFYAVARAGVFGDTLRLMRGRVLGGPVPMCCLRLGIPSI